MVDKETGESERIIVLSREDSYERFPEAEKQLAEDVGYAAVWVVMLEKLNEVLHMLTEKETEIIRPLSYQVINEVEIGYEIRNS